MPPDRRVDARALLGDFRTPLWIPRYSEGTFGRWSVSIIPATAARGYWGALYGTEGMVILTGPFADSGAAWMSIVPMEIESRFGSDFRLNPPSAAAKRWTFAARAL